MNCVLPDMYMPPAVGSWWRQLRPPGEVVEVVAVEPHPGSGLLHVQVRAENALNARRRWLEVGSFHRNYKETEK